MTLQKNIQLILSFPMSPPSCFMKGELTHCGLGTPYGWHSSESTMAQVMACCLTAPSHYLNQCWLIFSEDLNDSPVGNFTGSAQDTYPWYEFGDYWFDITAPSLRGQWVNPLHAKFFRGNINIYLHFMSLLHIDKTQVLKILPQVRPGPTYST